MIKILEKIKNIIFPSKFKCDVCEKEIDNESGICLCDECYSKLPFILHGCRRCGEKIEGDYEICYSCKNHYREFDRCYSVFEYSGLAKEMVWNLKYENAKYLAKLMAKFLTDQIVKENIKFNVLSYVPISKKNLSKRGYNQAELLAREIAINLGLTLEKDVLLRIKENVSQVELTAPERAKNIENSFIVNKKKIVKGKNILVVDDVLTTGATLGEIAKMLKKSGAEKVFGLTFANTTRKLHFEKENEQISTQNGN